jgi:hypothetical protein
VTKTGRGEEFPRPVHVAHGVPQDWPVARRSGAQDETVGLVLLIAEQDDVDPGPARLGYTPRARARP